jgi:NADPH:quinone reductase-like Zn-dependent oxidoreductase
MERVMRALRAHRRGGPEGLVYEEAAVPRPALDDVVLRVDAASLTPTELTWPSTWVDRRGLDRCPVIPCHEVSGVVVERGDGAASLEVGDEAFGLTDWYRDGAAAEFVAVEARNLAPRPRKCGAIEAASFPLAGLTAWQALFDRGGLSAHRSVLITGATGGVGALAVQLALAAGATVVAAGHGEQADAAAELGATAFVDLDDAKWTVEAGHVDLAFDLVGGNVLDQLAGEGIAGRTVSIVEPHEGVVYFVVEPDRATLTEIARRVDAGTLRAVVGLTVPLADGRSAFEANHAPPGKRIIVVPS